MTTREFRDKCFAPNSKPTDTSIRNWIKRGALKGKKLGGTYYVIINVNDNDIIKTTEDEIKPNFSRFLRDKHSA